MIDNDFECDDETRIDKAIDMISMMADIDFYVELQRIKYSEDRDKEIDFAMKSCEAKLRIWGVDPESLKHL